MIKDDEYYNRLDDELTVTIPEIDMSKNGSLSITYANIVVLTPEDMTIAKSLAAKKQVSVSDYFSQTLREQLA
ncbi:MAG: hypothetical protein LBC35_04045 [Coriobacteriales bacterium]|jgi:hypothetical protein|nr:hypothetical protein [Coriobacteriales bacterium]